MIQTVQRIFPSWRHAQNALATPLPQSQPFAAPREGECPGTVRLPNEKRRDESPNWGLNSKCFSTPCLVMEFSAALRLLHCCSDALTPTQAYHSRLGRRKGVFVAEYV